MNSTRQIPRSLGQCLRAMPSPASSSTISSTSASTCTSTSPMQRQAQSISLHQQQTRSASSFRRTQKLLRVQPTDDHFSKTTETQDHIVYNPPSSAPNVYHTPLKFLPPTDPRRLLHSSSKAASSSQSSAAAAAAPSKLPPSVRPVYNKKYHLSAEDVAEIRRLRTEDPRQWTRVRLAEKFGCSQFFVSLCATAPQIAEERKRELEEIKKRWGRAKKEAREDRQRRKELWGRE